MNAIYFKASWLYDFSETATKNGAFHLLDGSQVTVPMMSSSNTATLYEKGSDFQAVGLPYYGEKTMMVVVLPEEGKFTSFEAGLDAAKLDTILSGLEGNHIELTLPKFKLEFELFPAGYFERHGNGGCLRRSQSRFLEHGRAA